MKKLLLGMLVLSSFSVVAYDTDSELSCVANCEAKESYQGFLKERSIYACSISYSDGDKIDSISSKYRLYSDNGNPDRYLRNSHISSRAYKRTHINTAKFLKSKCTSSMICVEGECTNIAQELKSNCLNYSHRFGWTCLTKKKHGDSTIKVFEPSPFAI